MRGPWGAGVLLAISLICLLQVSSGVQAHFLLNLNVRIFHVEHLDDGLRIYMRMPMPYLVAQLAGPPRENGLPKPPPFTSNRLEDDKLVHYVDVEQVSADPNKLGQLAADGYRVGLSGKAGKTIVEQTRVHLVASAPGFATLAEAKKAITESPTYPADTKPAYVGDALVDVTLRHHTNRPVYEYAFSSTLDPGLPGQDDTANIILDYGGGETRIFRARGLMFDPIMISNSPLQAVYTFIVEGVRHILGGLDHVLFVLCLVLGAAGFRALILRATGFTIGHSVTLTLGFFGFVPSGVWFIPAIETGIALSIVYAGAMVFTNKDTAGSENRMFFVTVLIGLLHGLGFSFVLHKLLRVDSPDLWQSLLAFNVGVEIGQIAIILATWPALLLIARFSPRVAQVCRWALASVCISVALYWSIERVILLNSAI